MQKPTIGRKVWYWHHWNDKMHGVLDAAQAFDATVIYVHPDGYSVNLQVITHNGLSFYDFGVPLRDPQEGDKHAMDTGPIATWMPYQKAQHDKNPA